MEEFLDVVDRIKLVTSGTQENTVEAGDVSGGRLGNIIEAEARFRAHGTVCSHPDFSRRTGSRNNKIDANKMELELLSGLVEVDGDVVAIVHLLLDVTIYFFGNVGNLDM